MTLFASLLCETDPTSLAFPPPGSPYGTGLYIAANNRDLDPHDGADCGGTIQVVTPLGAWTDFTAPTGGPSEPGCSTTAEILEPSDIGFGPADFGSELYVANSNNSPVDVIGVTTSGNVLSFTSAIELAAPRSLDFGPGGGFGSDLYLGNVFDPRIDRVSSGTAKTVFATLPGPGGLRAIDFGSGAFGDYLYVARVGPPAEIWRVDASGAATRFATGLQAATDDSLCFSADGSRLYVADYEKRIIYRVSSMPSAETVRLGSPPNPTSAPSGIRSSTTQASSPARSRISWRSQEQEPTCPWDPWERFCAI